MLVGRFAGRKLEWPIRIKEEELYYFPSPVARHTPSQHTRKRQRDFESFSMPTATFFFSFPATSGVLSDLAARDGMLDKRGVAAAVATDVD